MPECWEEFAGDEVRWALAETRNAADAMLDLAYALEVKLPGTREAFRTGVLRQSKAEIIARATDLLDPAEARAAEALVLGRAGRLSPAGCGPRSPAPSSRSPRTKPASGGRRGPGRPGGALARGQRQRRPGRPRAPARRGPGRGPADHLVARQLKTAGLDGSMDELRARAYLDLLLDTAFAARHPGRPPATGEAPGSPAATT